MSHKTVNTNKIKELICTLKSFSLIALSEEHSKSFLEIGVSE